MWASIKVGGKGRRDELMRKGLMRTAVDLFINQFKAKNRTRVDLRRLD